jgi:hypothetical protein
VKLGTILIPTESASQSLEDIVARFLIFWLVAEKNAENWILSRQIAATFYKLPIKWSRALGTVILP